MLDMLDICGRIAKLEELKLKNPPVGPHTPWPELLDDEILSGIKEAEREVIKTIEGLGMLPLLVAGNILRLDDSGDILYMNPGIEALADIRDGPDESDTITVDELLDLENDVLCSAAETNEQCYSFALSDLAASSAPKSNEFNREEEAEEGDVDDDDPRHCHLFQKGNCKYANPAFKPPKTTHWIGCDYPGCDNWSHEPCLNIEFSSDLERDTYAFVCTSHGNVKGLEQYKDLVAAKASDTSMIEDDEQNVGTSQLKRRRRFNYGKDTSGTSQCSVPPNYVEYDGEFYHIAEFLSLQQGKVYNPSSSRMARWMAVSRNDFYERVEKLVAPNKSENGLYFEDVAVFWVPRLGLKCGLVLRLVRNTYSKSPVPVFEWKKGNESKEKISVCFQVLSHVKKENSKWLVSPTKEVMWSECKTHLLTFGNVQGERKWPLEVDTEAIETLLPKLEQEEAESRRKEESLKEIEKEKRKMGPPEDMTVCLLKEVLDSLNVTYRSNEKKPNS